MLEISPDDAPRVKAHRAGEKPEPGGSTMAVDAVAATFALVDRRAAEEVGGWPPIDDPDIAMVDLCCRLEAREMDSVVVQAAMVVDPRPVETPRA